MTMKRLILDLVFLVVATGLWVRAGGSIISAGSIFSLLLFLLLIGQWLFPPKNHNSKHDSNHEPNYNFKPQEIKLDVSPEEPSIPDARPDGAGIETHSRPSGLVAKSSLLEAVGRDVIAGQDLKQIGGRTLDYLGRYMRAETLLFLGDQRGSLEILAARGPDVDDLIGNVFKSEGNLAAVMASEKVVSLNMPNISADLKLDGEEGLTAKLAALGNLSLLLIGVGKTGMVVLASRTPDAFTKVDEAAVEGVAFQLGYIVENIIENQDLRRSVDELDKLLGFINKTGMSEDLSEALTSGMESVIELSGADNGSFFLFDKKNERLVLKAAVGLPESAMASEIDMGEGISGWVASHQRSIVIKDLENGRGESAGMGPSTAEIAISMPVMLGDSLVGVLNLGSKHSEHDFNTNGLTRTIRLLSQIGTAEMTQESGQGWQSLFMDTIRGLSQIIESRDPYSIGHAAMVAKYALDLATSMKLEAQEVQDIEIAGFLHDIGVAGITDGIFRLDQPLSSVERLLIKSHPKLGAKALEDIPRLRRVLPLILHHHENFDGTGYIDALKGEEIPLGARILAISEAYSAMLSERPYRRAKTKSEAIEELKNGAGTQFDPHIVYAFCSLVEKP